MPEHFSNTKHDTTLNHEMKRARECIYLRGLNLWENILASRDDEQLINFGVHRVEQ